MSEGGPTPPDALASAYDYVLPRDLIAQHPSLSRDGSRLLAMTADGAIAHRVFGDILELLRPGDLLVANDTRVLRARFAARRSGGGRAEVLLLHPVADAGVTPSVARRATSEAKESGAAPSVARRATSQGEWLALVRPGKRVRKGDRLSLSVDAGFEIVDWAPGGTRIVAFYGIDATGAMARFGRIPLPPYIDSPPDDADERYQTVYAARDGSVAAPTAGLHFTPRLLEEAHSRGIGFATITLDVGAGTFRPVSCEDVRDHEMHAERFEIGVETIRAIDRTRAAGGRVVAVGTTSLRALEAAAAEGERLKPGARWTSIFIYPPYRFRVVDALLTNFHLPKSSLLMLVSAFAGRRRVLDAYAEAVRERYRFYSFGDAMFLERADDL
jgi:S-adenosylmethionine:tRNA ribosyltransferase-isomerase